MVALGDCFEPPCLFAPFPFFWATALIAVLWAAALVWLLLSARPSARVAAVLWSLPVIPLVVMLVQRDPYQETNMVAGFLGWLWGLGFAWYVRRALRPMAGVDDPIVGFQNHWDLARTAFGFALVAPVLGPLLAALLAAPFD